MTTLLKLKKILIFKVKHEYFKHINFFTNRENRKLLMNTLLVRTKRKLILSKSSNDHLCLLTMFYWVTLNNLFLKQHKSRSLKKRHDHLLKRTWMHNFQFNERSFYIVLEFLIKVCWFGSMFMNHSTYYLQKVCIYNIRTKEI